MSGNEWLAVGTHPLAAEGFRNILDAAMHYFEVPELLQQRPVRAASRSRPSEGSCAFCAFFLRFSKIKTTYAKHVLASELTPLLLAGIYV